MDLASALYIRQLLKITSYSFLSHNFVSTQATKETEVPRFFPMATDITDIIYQAGDIIRLRTNNSNDDRNPIQVKVQRQTRPWTLTCVMKVSIEAPSGCSQNPSKDSDAFLKMFDRRGAQQLRQDHEIDAWTENIEDAFLTGLCSGE